MGTITGPNSGGGIYPDRKEVWLTLTNAQVRGDVLYVRGTTVDGTTTELDTAISCPAAPTTLPNSGIFVVVLDKSVAAGAKGRCLLRGKAAVSCLRPITKGDNLAAVSGKKYLDQAALAAAAVGNKIIAKPLSALTGSVSAANIECYFDGWSGFGSVAVS